MCTNLRIYEFTNFGVRGAGVARFVCGCGRDPARDRNLLLVLAYWRGRRSVHVASSASIGAVTISALKSKGSGKKKALRVSYAVSK